MVETIQIAHIPAELPVYVVTYRDVTNAPFLREQLLAGNTDFEYAFIDATMLVSTKHVLAAAFRALNDHLNERLKSRNVHSEIVFCLSSNNNIGEAFRRFGVSDTTTNLLVLKVATTPDVTQESVARHLSEHIKGTEVAFDNATIASFSDLNRIRKIYKISPAASGGVNGKANGTFDSQSQSLHDLETQILGLMALRGAT